MPKEVRFVYEFGPFRLDPAERMILRGDQILSMTPKALDTLIVLVENSRHIVTKEELMNRVWPDIYVEETNLAQHISMLRKILGERDSGGQYIETVPKRGYRFVIPVKKIKLFPTETSVATRFSSVDIPEREKLNQTSGGVQVKSASIPKTNRRSDIRPGLKLGRYEILSLIGAGGMGEVYLARDTQLERNVALKLLSERYTDNTDWLRRFVREAKAASALNHPNIITIHEVGEADGIHFIATEYIEGKTLRHQLAAGRMKPIPALNVAAQLASALTAAHTAGIVHRDVKPENIMLRPDGYVKLLDFGLAKPTEASPLRTESASLAQLNTDPGVIMGTVNYMSPEQARGYSVDTRSDVFSLGVVMYEMLTGRAPFEGLTTSDVIVAILDREPSRLSQTLDIPAELERIVGKSLRKDRNERYQTIKDFHLDLKSLHQELEARSRLGDSLAGEPVKERKSGDLTSPVHTDVVGVTTGGARKRNTLSEADFDIPEVRYTLSGEVNIAYQVIGDAPLDIVFVMGWISHLEYFWTEPSFARFLRRLATFARVILFDKRGTGLSDRVPLDQLPTLEQRMDDVRAVMEAVGSERAVLCGVSEGGPMCSLFAATHPEKTIALVMIGSYARRLQGEGYPWGPTEEEQEEFFEVMRRQWGGPIGLERRAPSVANDPAFRDWWAAYLRRGASPAAALALTKMNTQIDIRHVLPTVRVPTLVVHRSNDSLFDIAEGRYLAENIPGAKFVELPGIDHLPFVGDQEAILDEIEEFLTGMRHSMEIDRVLATVLIARVAESNVTDQHWQDLLDRHHSFVRKEIEMFKGRTVELIGDTLLATFDGPARAIRAAGAIRASAMRLGIKLQTGLHTGECDMLDDKVGGLAVEIAKAVAAESRLGEILASSTVKDLVAGSGIQFTERGVQELKNNLGEWRLFAVERGA
ncbi:MAG: alpha/beta fold hydrolase [Blastocatellia bacterium]